MNIELWATVIVFLMIALAIASIIWEVGLRPKNKYEHDYFPAMYSLASNRLRHDHLTNAKADPIMLMYLLHGRELFEVLKKKSFEGIQSLKELEEHIQRLNEESKFLQNECYRFAKKYTEKEETPEWFYSKFDKMAHEMIAKALEQQSAEERLKELIK